MEVSNARIKSVKVAFDDLDRLSARMTFEGQQGCCDWGFILTNPVDVQRLEILMKYTGTYDLKDLKGKIVRKIDHDYFIRGFGHPIEDKFVPLFGQEVKEVTQAKFPELLKIK